MRTSHFIVAVLGVLCVFAGAALPVVMIQARQKRAAAELLKAEREAFPMPLKVIQGLKQILRESPKIAVEKFTILEEEGAQAQQLMFDPEARSFPCTGVRIQIRLHATDISEVSRFWRRLRVDPAFTGYDSELLGGWRIEDPGDPRERLDFLLLGNCVFHARK